MFNKSSKIAWIVAAISGFLGTISIFVGLIVALLKLVDVVSISWSLALAPLGVGVVLMIIVVLAQVMFVNSFVKNKF